MAVNLEGGCRVSEMREGKPLTEGTLSIWNQIGRATGAQAISLRILEFAPGLSPGFRSDSDDILYVLGCWERGRLIGLSEQSERRLARVFINDYPYDVEPDTGAYLRLGDSF